MGRHTRSGLQMCRREGMKLYLKGSRCESPKCAIERRNVAPGMHGYRRGKPSEYGIRLREKQKLKRFYGVFERQFRRYFELASRSPENTGEVLLSHPGTPARQRRPSPRLRPEPGRRPAAGAPRPCPPQRPALATSRACCCKPTTRSRVKNGRSSLQLVKLNLQDNPPPVARLPGTTQRASRPKAAHARLPTRGDVDPRIQDIREQLIIEFCSR